MLVLTYNFVDTLKIKNRLTENNWFYSKLDDHGYKN